MAQIVITEFGELKSALKAIMAELIEESAKEKEKADSSDKLYTVNQVRKRLGKSHKKVSDLVKSKVIRSTSDGLISEAALREYLKKN